MLVPLAQWARRELEEQADNILAKDKRNCYGNNHSADYFGILSEDQLELRDYREMLTVTGRFEWEGKPGVYGRAWNPLANTRPTKQRQYSRAQDPWRQFSYESVDMGGNFQAWFPSARREEITSGSFFETWYVRDPAGATSPGQNYFYHLSRGQRCRIRETMKAIPTTKPLAREAVKAVICRQYGIPVWVIARVCRP